MKSNIVKLINSLLISDRCHCGDYYQEKIKDIPRLHSAHFDYGASKHKD